MSSRIDLIGVESHSLLSSALLVLDVYSALCSFQLACLVSLGSLYCLICTQMFHWILLMEQFTLHWFRLKHRFSVYFAFITFYGISGQSCFIQPTLVHKEPIITTAKIKRIAKLLFLFLFDANTCFFNIIFLSR